ncbi:MAG: ATP-binding protein, partial [Salinibacter sp.]|uniref:PAS domain-containing sensor histidine kinase n=1 Tax=Salinibacter sp. TaxID=2065818 RepID=UPI0035D42551
SWSLELPFEKPSGERLWLYSAATPERVGGELTFSGVLLDTTKRRQLERKVIAISDEEQRRIGENLHDVLASKLAGTSMVARSAATSLEKGNDLSADHLHEVADQIEEASRHARSLSQSLTPLEIQNGGLTEGLRNLVDRQESISGISCSFETEGHAELSEDVAAHLYRMGAEAMHNALRHADPNRVEIRLQFEEDHLVLSVKDDGKGILKETDSSDAHGLQLMQYRSDLIGAHLDIGPLEEGGTLVRCSLPMDQASQAFV